MASPSLIQLMEELLQAIEQRDAGDPDAPAWEARDRTHRLEEELAQRLQEAAAERGAVAGTRVKAAQVNEAIAGLA